MATDWTPDRPYNDLPLLPPQQEIETKAILKKCIVAQRALAELKQAARLIPNQTMLMNTLPLLEAQSSSEIENIVTTTHKLLQYSQASTTQADPATKEALRYQKALAEGFHALERRPLCTNTAVDVCRIIKGTDLDIRRVPGTTLANDRTGAVIYTPPEGEQRLRALLANWETFLHSETQLDPLVRMAIGHYQFEAVHPFVDGNGRTGRILNILFLIEEGLLTLPILYLSRYIIAHKDDYYRLLLNVTRRQDWEPWILYMLSAVADTATWTREKIESIHALSKHTAAYVKEKAKKVYSRELVDVIFERPYSRINNLVDANIVQRQTASTYLSKLVDIGVLQEHPEGKEKIFIHRKLALLLTRDNSEWDLYPHSSDATLREQGKN